MVLTMSIILNVVADAALRHRLELLGFKIDGADLDKHIKTFAFGR